MIIYKLFDMKKINIDKSYEIIDSDRKFKEILKLAINFINDLIDNETLGSKVQLSRTKDFTTKITDSMSVFLGNNFNF